MEFSAKLFASYLSLTRELDMEILQSPYLGRNTTYFYDKTKVSVSKLDRKVQLTTEINRRLHM